MAIGFCNKCHTGVRMEKFPGPCPVCSLGTRMQRRLDAMDQRITNNTRQNGLAARKRVKELTAEVAALKQQLEDREVR